MRRHIYQNWKCIAKAVGVISLLCWLLWVYQHAVIHAVNFVWSSEYRQCAFRRRTYELEEKTSPLYVTLKFHGRLGNWMWSYASLLGIAKANGYIPYLRSYHPLSHYFSLSYVKPDEAECLYTVYDDRPATYNPHFMNLPAGNITIDGYLQSWKYFKFIEKDVRHEFKMSRYFENRILKEFLKYVGKYVKEGRQVISIHIRRGDVLRPEAQKLGFTDTPKAYFDNAMKYMLEKHPHSVFFVTSDEIEWAKANIKPPKLKEVFGNKKVNIDKKLNMNMRVPIVFSSSDSFTDFGMLTFCNHSIISTGTFGWMSAWLTNGDVVHYNGFPLPGTKVDYETTKEDFYPPHWIGLSGEVSNIYFPKNNQGYLLYCLILECVFLHFLIL